MGGEVDLMAERATTSIVMLVDITTGMSPVVVLGRSYRPCTSVGIFAGSVTIVPIVFTGGCVSNRLALGSLTAVLPGNHDFRDGTCNLVLAIGVGNVRKRNRNAVRGADINPATTRVGWTGADRTPILSVDLEVEVQTLRFRNGQIGVGESCGIGLSETDARHQQGCE